MYTHKQESIYIYFFTPDCENDKPSKERKKERKEHFMAAFVCEVVLDLGQYVWAKLHFANYFLLWQSSQHGAPLSLWEEKLSSRCLVSPTLAVR